MLAHVPRLAFSLDPLIAEAKRRTRRRRVLVTTVLLLIAAVAVVAVTASRSPGGPRSGGPSHSPQVHHSASSPSQVNVPMGAAERQWRAWVLSHGFGLTVGARPATATPAAYLRHRLAPLVSLLGKGNRYVFMEAVGRHGSLIFESGTRTNRGLPEGSVDVPPPLERDRPDQ